MSKRNWTVKVEGYKDLQMVVLDVAIDYIEALRGARLLWPTCEVS